MDYETFGEHQWEDTGIFDFLTALPRVLKEHPDTTFKTPTETILSYEAAGEYDVPEVLTWADTDRDLTAWTGNDIQRDALTKIYALEADVLATEDAELVEIWRKLQTSDHFYYMCTKWSNDGDVHAYFSPYQSPYDAYIAFMNALSDLQLRVSHAVTLAEEKAQKRAMVRTVEPTQSVTKPVQVVTTSRVLWKKRLEAWWQKIRTYLPFLR
jgi:alpha-amylase